MDERILLCSHLIEKMKTIIKKVTGRTSGRQYKFYLDMLYGILKSKSIVLNNIAHSLNEDTTLKKTNERLYKNLMRNPEITERYNLIKIGLSYMRDEEKVFIIDDTDIVKPYGKAFEGMGTVRDASNHRESSKYDHGFIVTTITGLSTFKKQPIPFFEHVHSPNELDYLSINNITNTGVRRIVEHLQPYEAMFVADRGYDDIKFYKMIHSYNQYFLVRMRLNRVLIFKNSKVRLLDKIKKFKGKIIVPMTIYSKERFIKASAFKCHIKEYKEEVWVIITLRDDNEEPMVLVTNKPLINKEDVIHMVYRYSSRWRIEEYFRFKKVELDYENFRVKSLDSINNLVFALNITILLLIIIIEEDAPYLYKKILKYSKSIKDKTSIELYKILSGVTSILSTNKKGVKNYKPIERRKTKQLLLFK